MIRGLDEASNTDKTRLSHIDPGLFSKALVDIVADGEQLAGTRAFQDSLGKLPASDLKDELEALARHAGSDIQDLREEIGSWFDTRMDALQVTNDDNLRTLAVVTGGLVHCIDPMTCRG
ncbi:MAG: hypothetical protein ACI8Y4_004749 [Candidatus Poriferisodalaceae bacterium]